MTDERDPAVQYKIKRAWETLDEAELMAQAGHWNACINRLYYACFYAVSALLQQHGLLASKHSAVQSLFNRHFVKTGAVTRDLGSLYGDLLERRQEGDYDDFVSFTEADVRPFIARARLFIQGVVELIAAPTDEIPDA